jgi:ectoine hydroxylase-related dioxygenase (phytanoyl-CoA dioxygenase family)
VIARDRVIEGQSRQTCSTQVEQYGYAIVPSVFGSEEIQKLATDLQSSDLPRSRAGIRHLLRHSAVSQVANDPRLLGIAQAVLGDKALPFKATLFDKSPDSNWLIVWHQDTALPLQEKQETAGWGPWSVKEGITYAHAPAEALNKVLASRLHLDDSTNENGPLRILPGTHASGVLTDEEVEREVAKRAAIDCTVARGGVVAMRPLTIHASSKSHSAPSRRVLHVEYSSQMAIGENLRLAIS